MSRGRATSGAGARALALASLVLVVPACPAGDDGDDGGVPPAFPEDYEGTYVEVRNCRGSGDHDLNNIRILADPAALPAYQGRDVPFPEGAVVLKEEFGFGDTTCSGELVQWTVMQKLAEGSAPDMLGWKWQEVDAARRVVSEDDSRCIGCHQGCGVEPEGYDWTCAVP